MSTFRLAFFFLLGPVLVVTACYASGRTCYTPEQAADHADKDICVAAHVFNVVESADGTRYLDLCKPEIAGCRFVVLSMAEDRKDVGSLAGLREQDVHLRGTVHVLHGQSVMLLSHARQFHDGPEKFRPNPALLNGFSAGSEATAFKDPAMSGHKTHQSSVFAGSRPDSKY